MKILSVMIIFWNSLVFSETFTLPGETTKPSSDGLIHGQPGLVGVFYGHLPCQDCQREKTLLIFFEDPKSHRPKGYTLERIGVGRSNERLITKGRWKWTTHKAYGAIKIYQLDDQPPELRRRFLPVGSILLVLDKDFKILHSSYGDPFTAAYSLQKKCPQKQSLDDC